MATSMATSERAALPSVSPPLRLTLAIIGAYFVLALALLPFARQAGPAMPGFNSAFGAGVFVTEFATAFLLLVLFRQVPRLSVLLLANAYLYSALMALAYVLAYPDAVMPGRALIGGSQSVSWIYNCWIAGYALLTLAAVLLETRWAGVALEPASARPAAAAACLAVAATVVVIVATSTILVESLPPLIAGGDWTTLNGVINFGAVVALGASLLMILLAMRPRSDLFLWLSLALTAIAFGNVISAVGGGRYTVGWYACRLSWLASGCVLLLYFLFQFVRQHGLLVRTTDDLSERTRERDRIWNVSEDLLGVSTFEGYFISLNPAWTNVLGWGEDEIRSMHVSTLRHPDDAAHSMAGRARLAEGVPTVRVENRFRHKDGSWRWVAWTMTAERGLIYVAGRHVTAEREAQEALRKAEADAAHRQKMEALGQLTGGVAHDFNNLLMVVSGFIPRLKAAVAGDGKARQAAEAIEMAVQRGAALTRQLLSFARRQPINPVVVDIGERLVAMTSILKSTLGSFIELKVEVEPALWPVRLDANELELALLNLVLNARDAMTDGGTVDDFGAQRAPAGGRRRCRGGERHRRRHRA